MILYLLIALNLACVFVCHRVAKKRGADVMHWSILGALLGPLAIPFVFFARPIQS